MTLLSSHPSRPLLRRGIFVAFTLIAFIVQGCGKAQNEEAEKKAAKGFYQHTDSKPDPYLQKKDD